MADDIIQRLQKKQEEIQNMLRQEERRQGREDQLKKTLQEEFGVDSILSAQEEMAKIAAQNSEDEAQLVQLEKEMDSIITNAKVGE